MPGTHIDYTPTAWIPGVRSQIDTYHRWQQTAVTLTAINQELFRRRVRDEDPE